MAFKLYGIPESTYTRIVALIAKERNIPYEFVPVDLLTGEHKRPTYLAHHPFGKSPTYPYVVRLPSVYPAVSYMRSLLHRFTLWIARRWFRAVRIACNRSLPCYARGLVRS